MNRPVIIVPSELTLSCIRWSTDGTASVLPAIYFINNELNKQLAMTNL